MAQTAHTPGPWKATGSYVMAAHGSVALCDVGGALDTATEEANARLIAEAPAYDEVAREMAAFRDAGKQVPARLWQKLYDTIERASHPRATGEA